MPSLTRQSAEQLDAGRKAAKKILGAYPDYGKASPEYIVGFAEALSYLSPAELEIVTDPRHGLAARCQYLPTIADIHQCIRDRKAADEQFKPAPTTYQRLGEMTGPWDQETDFERKKRVVMECLGYNPDARGAPAKRVLVEPTEEEVRNLKLKTPPAPPSRYLIEQLQRDGWPFIPQAAE